MKPFTLKSDMTVSTISMESLTRLENPDTGAIELGQDAMSFTDITDLADNGTIYVPHKGHAFADPCEVLERKILHLARLLDCSEAEATHAFLHNL